MPREDVPSGGYEQIGDINWPPEAREDIPEELVEIGSQALAAIRTPPSQGGTDTGGGWTDLTEAGAARAVLSAVSEAGWVRLDDAFSAKPPGWDLAVERDAARAQSEALAEALEELLIGGADAVSMEHAKRAAKVVLRSYRKARDA